ncbi:type IV pilus secretin PilQ [Hippea alviniae]|uniref:type IV pilus secretin PilQ n=1 Tax=Hippea alviniae TaxID=1279027 RepID=UPI0003B3354C|nr:type IV pilus secretin PilQ [Hippea alviniae]
MKTKKVVGVVLLVLIWSLMIGVESYSAIVQGIRAANGVCEVYYSGDISCNKIELSNPPRIAIDLIGVDKCERCGAGVKILRDGDVFIKSSLHSSPDAVYKLYGKPTERIVFVFKHGEKPICKMDKAKGHLEIIYGESAKKKSVNEIERISLRRFKNYEMIVVLLKKKPDYKLAKKGRIVSLVFDNVSSVKEALENQYFDNDSYSVNSIVSTQNENKIKYIITLKKGAYLKRYYADKRHVYLIFSKERSVIDNGNVSNVSKKDKNVPGNVSKNIINVNRIISFDVRDAQLKDVFRVFSQISGLNFIIGSDVKGTLTMRLKDVPLNQAFELILQQEGLVAERMGNIVIIETASRYQREKMQQLKALQDKEKLERMKNAITKVINLNYITPDYAINIINKLLYNGSKSKGFIVSDVKNNALICHDTADNIAKIEKIVRMIDHKKKAVEIDARIVEISKNFERQLGIQWGGNYFRSNIGTSSTFFGVGGYNSPADVSNGLPPTEKFNNNNFVVNLPASVSMSSIPTVSLAIGNVNANYNLDLKLTMGEIEGYTKVLSSPKVVTLDNEPAQIESGQAIPYNESTKTDESSIKFVDATLSLDVTPHITGNNVILKIKVKKDSPDYSHSVNGEPPINKNSVSTTVILKNGQTLVIGGLIQRTTEKTVNGVPGLMRIPLLGWLFKTRKYSNPQRELYIFVTPHIISD